MRILIPNFFTPDSFEENVAVTLEQMGHSVRHMGPISVSTKSSPFHRLFNEVKMKVLKLPTLQERWLVEQSKDFKPDLVISLTQCLSEEVLSQVRSRGTKAVSWWGDPSANMTGQGLCHKEWDLIFIKDHYAAFKLQSLNLPAIHLYEAMNPMWHKPVASQSNNQVVLAGTFYDYRHYLAKKLLEGKIELGLYGGRLPYWASSEVKRNHTGRYVTKDEKSQIFGSALAVLNSTSMREFSSVNCRAFEIAGTGGLQIMEYRQSIEECFEPGKEILLYKNLDELFEMIDRAKKDPAAMKLIRTAAAARALHEHTYKHRLDVIIKKVKEL